MKRALLLLIYTVISHSALAEYAKLHLPELIEKSSIIVHGRIVSVGDSFFKIMVLKTIKGLSKVDTIGIQKFKNWECASRYDEYQSGQGAIFFLEQTDGTLRTTGAGNDGELVVLNDSVYVSDDKQNSADARIFSFLNSNGKFKTFALNTVVKGIILYLDNLPQINRELGGTPEGTVAYQYSYIEKLPRNSFLELVIVRKRKLYRRL